MRGHFTRTSARTRCSRSTNGEHGTGPRSRSSPGRRFWRRGHRFVRTILVIVFVLLLIWRWARSTSSRHCHSHRPRGSCYRHPQSQFFQPDPLIGEIRSTLYGRHPAEILKSENIALSVIGRSASRAATRNSFRRPQAFWQSGRPLIGVDRSSGGQWALKGRARILFSAGRAVTRRLLVSASAHLRD